MDHPFPSGVGLTVPLLEQLSQALGPSVQVERELGGGGMSRTYVALDRRLDRRIVVKLLAPELASGVSADRFEREIRLAAGLQHPHIVPLLAAGEVAGLPYFTMPFIEGESLRRRLEQSGALGVYEAVRLLGQVAAALEYAHARGLVHRDIKPDNVLLSPGGAMVTDFGVAKAIQAASTTTAEASAATMGLTAAGFALGTPAYMAPEQAVGDPATDARADLYAFGVMAYECFTGDLPFPARSPQAMVAAHLTEPPPPIGARRPDLPPALAALVMRCLAKLPDQRPGSAGAIVAVLDQLRSGERDEGPAPSRRAPRWLRPAAAGLAVLLVVATLVRSRPGGSREASPTPVERAGPLRIAVLPFENIGDSSEAYFADGVADAVRGKLAEVRSLQVVARSSSVSYAGTRIRPAEVARELGVRYLLTGTVRWARQPDGQARVLVAPELVEIGPDRVPATEWSDRFDAGLTDVFKVQADIAGRVAQALGLKLGVAEIQQLASRPTSDIVAYDAYLRAEAFNQRFLSGEYPLTDSVTKYYREAVRRDSSFARAWAKLAGAQSVNFINTGRPRGGAAPVHAVLARVERLAPNAPETAFLQAQVAYNVDQDTATAFRVIRDALERFPNNGEIAQFAGSLRFQIGDFDAALAYARRGIELDPKSKPLMLLAGLSAVMARRYAEARPLLDRYAQLDSTSVEPAALRVASYLGEGDTAAARRTLSEAQRRFDRVGFTQVVMRWGGAVWLLDPGQRRLVLGASVDAFDGFATNRALAFMAVCDVSGDSAAGSRWADSILVTVPGDERLLGAANPGPPAIRALALSRLGQHDAALAGVAEAVRRSETDRIGFIDPLVRLAAARVLMAAGRKNEAMTRLEQVLRAQYMVSAAWLRVDPTWAPLRGQPGFQRLVAAP